MDYNFPQIHYRDLFRKIGQPLGKILEKCSRGWFLQFRETVIAELKNRKTNESELEAVSIFWNWSFCLTGQLQL